MATSGSFTTNHVAATSRKWYWEFIWSTSYSGNTATVNWEIYARCETGTSGSTWVANYGFSASVNGQSVSYSSRFYKDSKIASGSFTKNGGSSFSASITAHPYSGSYTSSGSGSWTLDAKHLTSLTFSNTGQSYNSLSFKWTCSPNADYLQMSLNGGAWVDVKGDSGSTGTSGTFTISGLSQSTSYTVKIRLRRTDSGLWSESSTITKSTSSGYTSVTQFVVNKVTGRSDQLKITWAASNACDKGWYSIDNGKTWVEGLSYPDQVISGLSGATSYNIKIKVRRKDSQMVTTSGTVTQTTYAQTKFTKNNVNHISGYSGLSQLKVEWATNITISKLELSLNNGFSWTDKGKPNSKSGNFTITSLSINTYYNIKLRATSKDGSVVVTTGTIKQNTYNKVTGNLYKNGTKLNITTGIQITTTDKLEFKDISNPANCSYKVYFETPDNTRRITQEGLTLTANQIQSMFQYLPNSNSQAFNVGIATLNGTTEAQYQDFYGTLVVTNSNPTFNNFTYEDTDTKCKVLTGGNQGIIKGYSDVKINISNTNKAVAKDYATISKYRIIIGEKQKEVNYSSSSNVSGQIDNVENNVFTVYAIDSRGNSTAKQISPSAYYNYSNIKITKASIARTNPVGTETELSFEGQYWNNSFGAIVNSIVKCYYQYKTTNSDKWITGATTLTLTFDGSKFSFKGVVKGDEDTEGFSATENFNVRLYVEDRLSNDTYSDLTLGSGIPEVAIAKKGVAVGGMYRADLGEGLQIYGKLFLNGKEITN